MAKMVTSTPAPTKEQRRYEVEDAMRVIARAEELKKDERLMREVRDHHASVKKALGREPRKEPERKRPERKR